MHPLFGVRPLDRKQHGFVKDHDRKQRTNNGDDGRTVRKRGGVVKFKSMDANDLVEQVSTNCSTKWLSYVDVFH